MYKIPVFKVSLVRERTMTTEARKQIRSADDAYAVLAEYLDGADRENFVVLLLDTKHRVIGVHTVSVGSLDASLVHPREVFKPAILANCSGIIAAHNHRGMGMFTYHSDSVILGVD